MLTFKNPHPPLRGPPSPKWKVAHCGSPFGRAPRSGERLSQSLHHKWSPSLYTREAFNLIGPSFTLKVRGFYTFLHLPLKVFHDFCTLIAFGYEKTALTLEKTALTLEIFSIFL